MRLARPALRRAHQPLHAATGQTPRTTWKTQRRSYAASISAAELEFGQPVHETHPHILKAGETTPGITAQEYADRRAKLAFGLPAGAVAVLASAEVKYRSGVVFYPFRQESNFLYLTGFSEPQSVAVIRKTGPALGDCAFHLFCRPKDAFAEQWTGPWSGLRAAEDVFNADEAADIHALSSLLPPLLRGASRVYTDVPLSPQPTTTTSVSSLSSSTAVTDLPAILSASFSSSATAPPPLPLFPHINPLRAIKSPAEIASLRHAGRVSGRALTAAMRRAFESEHALQAFLAHAFAQDGLSGPAYVPVVAGGRRGRLIHYTLNAGLLRAGDTVLVDAGGEYGGYASDITRVWPVVAGGFSAPQRDLYEAVLAVQRRCVGLCRASAGLSLDEVHRVAEVGLAEELGRLGFELGRGKKGKGDVMDVLFPHHVGHYVGLDVHDVPGYPRSVPLRTGHCVTVEPGVYVPDDEQFPKHFRGLAVRIEDSVCVDDDSAIVLTAEAVKEVADIEALK